jgi:hypothetical protein
MKNRITLASLALLLTLQPAALMQAQAAPQQASRQELFDGKKSGRDLEVMKGIIRTTLGFVTDEINSSQPAGTRSKYPRAIGEYYGSSSIAAYYLVGQGAVFTIPASSISNVANAYFEGGEFHVQALNDELLMKTEEMSKRAAEMGYQAAQLAQQANAAAVAGQPVPPTAAVAPVMAPQPALPPATPAPEPQVRARSGGSGSGSGIGGGVSGGVVGGVPGGTLPSKIASTGQSDEKIRQKMISAQERLKQQQESLEQRRAKFNESLVQFKAALIEALASHGDTLSQVKPNEYVTIIISEDNRMLQQSQVLSVQKSAITDYKAGRISMDALRAKVLDYSTEE